MESKKPLTHYYACMWTYASECIHIIKMSILAIARTFLSIRNRSTPVECLHTVLLGSYKYLFRDLMEHVSAEQKMAISARIDAFPASGIELKLSKSACR